MMNQEGKSSSPANQTALNTICTSTSTSPSGAGRVLVWVSSTQTLPNSKKDMEKHISASKHLWPCGSSSQGHPTLFLTEQTAQSSAKTDPSTLTVRISSRTTSPYLRNGKEVPLALHKTLLRSWSVLLGNHPPKGSLGRFN